MIEIHVYKLTGVGAMLMGNAANMKGSSRGLGKKHIPTPEDEAESLAYRNEQGELYVPCNAIRACLIAAGTSRKIGSKSAPGILSASVFTIEDGAVLRDAKTGKPLVNYEIHKCRAVVQRNAVVRCRPMIRNWELSVPLELDREFITPEIVLELLNIAGKVAGLLDYRPNRKGMFGRFSAELPQTKN